MTALLLVLLSAGPAAASGLPEFSAPLAQSFVPTLTLAARPKAPPRVRRRAADAETWARMIEGARLRPTLTYELRAGDADYKVFAVLSDAAWSGQQCPADAKVRNALYVAEPVGGLGGAVYPARLVSLCVGPAQTLTRLALDADAAGFIQDAAFFDPVSGRLLRPGEDHLSPAQQARFDAALAELVRLFAQ